jgi:hypothetical protein
MEAGNRHEPVGSYLMAKEVAADMIRREERNGVFVNISSFISIGQCKDKRVTPHPKLD